MSFFKNGKLPKLIKKHDLVKLWKEANIKMAIKEEEILTRLSRQSEWRSRYPVPVLLSDIQNVITYSNGKWGFIDYYTSGDVEKINAIVKKVRRHVEVYMKEPRLLRK